MHTSQLALDKLLEKYHEVSQGASGMVLKHTMTFSLKPGMSPLFCCLRLIYMEKGNSKEDKEAEVLCVVVMQTEQL